MPAACARRLPAHEGGACVFPPGTRVPCLPLAPAPGECVCVCAVAAPVRERTRLGDERGGAPVPPHVPHVPWGHSGHSGHSGAYLLLCLPCQSTEEAGLASTRRLSAEPLLCVYFTLQAPLLQRMIAAEVDAILVKVAAAGLVPAKHLGAHLATLPAQVLVLCCAVLCCAVAVLCCAVLAGCALLCCAVPGHACRGLLSCPACVPFWLSGRTLQFRPAPSDSCTIFHPSQLHALRRLYGSNVCGEGGEYESLTLDCPALFTHGRIVLDSWEAVTVSPDSMAPVALLHPTAFHVEAKQPPLTAAAANGEADAAGAVAREAAAEAAAVVVEVPADWTPAARRPAPAPAAAEAAEGALDVQLGIVDGSQYCTVSASVATPGIDGPDLTSAAGTAAALSAALRRVSDALPALGLGLGQLPVCAPVCALHGTVWGSKCGICRLPACCEPALACHRRASQHQPAWQWWWKSCWRGEHELLRAVCCGARTGVRCTGMLPGRTAPPFSQA